MRFSTRITLRFLIGVICLGQVSVANAGATAAASNTTARTQEVRQRRDPLPTAGVKTRSVGVPNVTAIRIKAIRQAVTTWSVQNTVADWSLQAMLSLKGYDEDLNKIFDFSGLVLYGRIVPPVISQANRTFKVINDRTATTATTEYRLESASRIVTNPPSWRDYLSLAATRPNPISDLLTPKNVEEQSVWDNAMRQGQIWGQAQAVRVFDAAMARMERDYIGMSRARLLMRQGVITTPVLARGREGIHIEGDTMTVGSTILRITRISRYAKSTQWKAIVSGDAYRGVGDRAAPASAGMREGRATQEQLPRSEVETDK